MLIKLLFRIFVGIVFFPFFSSVFASTSIDLSKAANMGLSESFDEAVSGAGDLKEKNGLKNLPTGSQTFRGVPFRILDPASNQGRSFVVLKGRKKPSFPDGVSIPVDHLKASFLYFLHTCRWGGTAQNITVAEYDVVYDDGQVVAIPLRVGVEFNNFFNPDDTSASYLAWWHKYKNVEMGINFFPWKNPRPDKSIQSILFKSRGNMPVPILFAVTASDKELPISLVSPKPEKEVKTDTSKWIPFEPSTASPAGTAIDMSFLLDAPAGKHGKVKAEGDKLVFEDGTPAKFWGVNLFDYPAANEKPTKVKELADRLAVTGCNVVLTDGGLGKDQLDLFKSKGIYVCVHSKEAGSGQTKTPTPDLPQEDPAVFSADLLNLEPKTWGFKENLDVRVTNVVIEVPFIDNPMVSFPELSLPFNFSHARKFGRPFGVDWVVFWPNEFLSEIPLLISSYSSMNGYSASFGMDGGYSEIESMFHLFSFFDQPRILVQWPTASLAYQRGDLKEGKVFVLNKESDSIKALAHKSGLNPEGGKFKTDRSGELKAKVNEKTKSFVSDTGQITWQGNVGVVKIEAPRFQALIGFLSHRKFNNPYWAVETPNVFASLSAISLNNKAINVSDRILLTGVTRMENTGMVYNQTKTKLLNPGKAPILVEPLNAKIVLYRFQADPKLKIRALDANGQPLKTRVSAKWVKNSYVFSWVSSAFYLEIYK